MTLCPPRRTPPSSQWQPLPVQLLPWTTDSSHLHCPTTQGMKPFFTPTFYLAQEAGGLNLTVGLPAQRALSQELHARVGVGHPNHGIASTEVRALRLYIPSTPLFARVWGWWCFLSREERQLRSPWKHEEESWGTVSGQKAWELSIRNRSQGGWPNLALAGLKPGKRRCRRRCAARYRSEGWLVVGDCYFSFLCLVVTPNTLRCFPSPGMEEGSWAPGHLETSCKKKGVWGNLPNSGGA